MQPSDRPLPSLPASWSSWWLLASLGVGLLLGSPAPAQGPPLRLGGVRPGGARNTATENWGTFDFDLTNQTDTDRLARVFVLYDGQPDLQYGRDLWVPARSALSSWLLVGPAEPQEHTNLRDVQVLLYERSGGQEHLLLPPGEERVRSRGIIYHKREPFAAILLDREGTEDKVFGRLPEPESTADEAVRFVRMFRQARHQSQFVQVVNPGFLPPTAEAFDGLDQFVLASGRLLHDPAGMQALRRWVERGGTLWVMLDLVGPDVLAPLLGEALDFEVVDRVSLTSVQVETHPAGQGMAGPPTQQYERPVDLVRVLLPAGEPVRHTVNGWPAWFTRPVGRGKVVFTTLGARAWYQPRTRTDPPSPYPEHPALPVATPPLEHLAAELQAPAPEAAFAAEVFQAPLTEQIGYAVISRTTVALVFGAFLLVTLVLGVAFRRSRRPELLGWLAPAAALVAAGAFAVLGETSRRTAAPTVAVAQVVDAVSGTDEAAVQGLLEVYRPDSGPAEAAAAQGGLFTLDMTGVEGQTRRLVLTDLDAWHWENLALPAGVRSAPFRYTARTGEPLTAVARFGPGGVEGRLTAAAFRGLGDALVVTPGGRNLAVRLGADGTFSAGVEDVLPAGQFLAGAVLTDLQQRRQRLYREFLQRTRAGPPDGRNLLLAWAAEPLDMHFTLAPPGARTVGTALLVVPLRLERPAVGTHVTIPGPFLPFERIVHEGAAKATLESGTAIDMHLRFQLPDPVLPLQVERARLVARVKAPSRRVTIAGRTDGGLVELRRVESPLDPILLDVTDARLLRLDAEGGLHLNLAVSDPLQGGGEEKWAIESLDLEVAGRTIPGD